MKKLKLIHKVFLSMIFVFLIPTISITFQSLHCSTEAVYDLQEDALYSQAVRVNQEINSWLEERVNDLKLWQEHRNLLTYLAPKHQNHTHWKQDSSYESLLLFNEKGERVQTFGALQNEFTSLSSEIMKTLRQKGFALLGNTHNTNENHYSIHLGVAVTDQNQQTSYNVVTLNITQAFQKIFAVHSQKYPYAISIITNSQNDILGKLKNQNTEQLTWFFRHTNTIGNLASTSASEKIALSQKSLMEPWLILISADKQKTFHWIQILKERIGLTAILSVIIVLLLGALLSWGISRPFQSIIEYAKNITSNRISPPQNSSQENEALIVINAIDEMLETIQKKNIEIQNKSTLATVGELTSSVVHEFRNPLSSVKMNLQAVKAYLKEEDTYSELTQIAFEQTLKLEKMLSELLTYGKPVTLQPEKILLESFIESIKTQLPFHIQQDSLTIQFLNPDAIQFLRIDREKMFSVLINLIENAAHAMNGSGTIEVLFSCDQKQFHLFVKDNGPGIPENLLNELFLPFVTSRDEGTGLGLAIVMKFVKLHGGNISAMNQESSGALFHICLPKELAG